LSCVFKDIPYTIALKPFLGHTLGGCGVIELSILWLAIKDKFLPKNIKLEQSRKSLKSDIFCADNLYIISNHFGFGGNGTVLVLYYGVKR
jgi:3-oxoacyl-[acyl-carrier-protein] synthase-1